MEDTGGGQEHLRLQIWHNSLKMSLLDGNCVKAMEETEPGYGDYAVNLLHLTVKLMLQKTMSEHLWPRSEPLVDCFFHYMQDCLFGIAAAAIADIRNGP
jgi:hypothetical protein